MALNATAQNTTAKPVEANVNRRIVMLMWDRKLTQTKLAARLGLTQSGLSKKLHGRTGCGIDEISTVAHVLNTTVAHLFGESEVGPAGIEPTTSTVESSQFNEIIELSSFRTRRASAS